MRANIIDGAMRAHLNRQWYRRGRAVGFLAGLFVSAALVYVAEILMGF